MTTSIAIVLLAIIDIYLLMQIDKHETAIYELLKRHPELLEEDNDETIS